MSTAVAIVATACRYPDADSPDELWRNVVSQRRAFRRLPPERLRREDYWSADPAAPDRTYAWQAAVLDGWEFDRVRFRISGSTFRGTDLAHWLALEVAADALAAAGYPNGAGLDRERTAVIVGNTLTGEFSRARTLRLRWPYVRRVVAARLAEEEWSDGDRARFLAELETDYKAPFEPIDEDSLAGGLSNTIAGRICNSFDLKGGGYTVDGACAASLLSVATACSALAADDVDYALAGGVDLSLDPFELVGFAKAGALAPEEMRVYDRRSQGFWPGEGCGFVVLRRLEDALADGQPIVAVVRGWGVSSDGAGGITRPEAAGQVLALRRAYRRAGFGIESVELFEGHGTGTSVGDRTELEALSLARREAGARTPAAIGSVKANIGHTKAAAGMAGLLKAALSLRHQVIPPTTGCVDPADEVSAAGAALRVVQTAEPWPEHAPLRAAVSAMGFGGINTHIVLEAAPGVRRHRLPAEVRQLSASVQDAELFTLGTADERELDELVRSLRDEAGALSLAELGDLAAALAAEARDAPLRAALVASTPSELGRSLDALAALLASVSGATVDVRRGVALGRVVGGGGDGAPRIGFLFPGQGSPASRDGGAVGQRFPFTRDALDRAELPDGDLVETALSQPAIVAGSLGALSLLDRLGVEASVAVGHSLGELTALNWAGVLDDAAVVELAAARGLAMSELGERGGAMASLATDGEEAARLAAGTGAVIAGFNGPMQTVVSGFDAAIGAVTARAERAGVAATRLNVSHAFHSPLVAPAAARLADVLRTVELQPPARRIVSTVTGSALAADADVRALLIRQVTEPVRFADALARAAREADVLVEVGPGRTLTGLAEAAVDTPVLPMEAGGASLRGSLFAAGALWALGAPVRLEQLFEGRFTRPFARGRRRAFLANPCEAAPPDAGTADPSLQQTVARLRSADAPAPVQETPAGESESPLSVVRALVAARSELPVEALADDARLLGDLHLSSIVVAEIAADAAHALGLAPPAAPGEIATATIAELAAVLERLETAGPEGDTVPAGVASWVRPFETVLVERSRPAGPCAATRWHVIAPPDHPLAAELAYAFAGDDGPEGVVVALPPDPDDSCLALLVAGVKLVQERGAARFALLQHGGGAAAFARVLHLEHHALDTCIVDLPLDPAYLADARAEAESAIGHREVELGAGGRRTVPVLRQLELADGPLPLECGDVLLVTGGGKGIAAECSLALARSGGLSLGIIGRSRPETDDDLAANLRRLDTAGVPYLYAAADVTDARATREAVEQIEARLGPVSGIVHAAGRNVPALLVDLEEAALRETLAPKVEGLRNVLAAVDESRLRLVVGFGSIIARIGLRGEGHYALANEWLGSLVQDLARRLPDCRCLDIAWSVWAGVGMGERLGTIEALARAGVDAITVEEGVRMFERLVRAAPLPASVVASGRFGLPPTAELERREPPFLRFLEMPRLEYPGIELVVDVDLSHATDPYLADHVLDGVALLPAVIGLEAMAQVAAALGRTPPAAFRGVQLLRPVTVPPEGARRIRLAALRGAEGSVDVVLRSDETGFQADHFRATCTYDAVAPEEVDASPQRASGEVAVTPDELYGTLFFHGARFRRVRRYNVLRAHECTAEIECRDAEDWFGAYAPQRLLLGDPGARDATIHLLQACIPGGRILPVGVERITIVEAASERAIVTARERSHEGETFVWDLEVRDADGRLCERWDGLALRRIGPAPELERWPLPLLAAHMERRLAELAVEPVAVALRAHHGPRSPDTAGDTISEAAGTAGPVRRRADGKPEIDGAEVSAAHVNGYTLAVAGSAPLACDVEAVEARGEELWRDLLGAARFELAGRVCLEAHEELDASAARIWAAAECARKVGRSSRDPLALEGSFSDGWTLLRAGRSPVATYVVRVADDEAPLAFAFLVEGDR